MRDFVNTKPEIPHRFDAETVRRFQEHEADDYAAGSDDEAPITGGGWPDWLVVGVVLATCCGLWWLLPLIKT